LFEIVSTLHSPSGLAGSLYGRQQQCNQNSDDGNDDQQLDKRETRAGTPLLG
jgi:hypothetical protein